MSRILKILEKSVEESHLESYIDFQLGILKIIISFPTYFEMRLSFIIVKCCNPLFCFIFRDESQTSVKNLCVIINLIFQFNIIKCQIIVNLTD